MARPEFHSLAVNEVRKETDEATSVSFSVPDALADAYRFTQGQYLTLRATVNGEELRRPYSVCVAPDSGDLRVCVKRLHEGRFSSFVNDVLQAGDKIDVMGPMGRFNAPLEGDAATTYLFIAGGSGITPVMSNIRTILAAEPASQITLIYGNRRGRDIIFREALSDLKDLYLERLRIFHVLSDETPETPLFGGMLSQDKISELVQALVDVKSLDWAFICGPGPVMDGGKAALTELGMSPEQIKIESFGERPVARDVKPKVNGAAAPGENMAKVEVVFRGLRTQISVPFEGAAILDVAHEAKIDVPFACKGGVCCTCRAKLIEGEVDMDIVYGLEPDEIEAGYILTCQSHPKTAKVVVDYDG